MQTPKYQRKTNVISQPINLFNFFVIFAGRKYGEDILGFGADETKCSQRDKSRTEQ